MDKFIKLHPALGSMIDTYKRDIERLIKGIFVCLAFSGCASTHSYESHEPKTDVENRLLEFYRGKDQEKLVVITLDEKGEFKTGKVIASGSKRHVDFNFLDVYMYARKNGSNNVVVAHNHISYHFAMPSEMDLNTAQQAREFGKKTGLNISMVVVSDAQICTY